MEALRRRIAETAAWCEPRASVKQARDGLRSPQLAPAGEAWIRARGDLQVMIAGARRDLIEDVAERRAALLGEAGPRTDAARRGRLLLYSPHGTGWDGAAEYVTNGFFDEYETPPWDCWVAWLEEAAESQEQFSSGLLCWIPPKVFVIAEDGAAVSPTESLVWAAAVDTPLTRRLREAGLL